MTTYKSNGGWGNAGYTWGDYDSFFTKYQTRFQNSEDKRKFKTKLSKLALERFIPMNIKVNNFPTSVSKKRRMNLSVNFDDLASFDSDAGMEKILNAYDKIPFNSTVIDDATLKRHLTGDSSFTKFVKEGVNATVADQAIRDYFRDSITYEQLMSHFEAPDSEANEFGKATGINESMGDMYSSKCNVSTTKYQQNIKLIRDKIKLVDKVEHEAELRKGKRINRGFINQTSYKPLVNKSIESAKRKKLFVLIDASGSMSGGPLSKAGAFAGALANSGVFDMDHIIWHNDSGWIDVIKDYRKEDFYGFAGCGEGFENLEDNLDRSYVDEADYIVVLTDLCIGEEAQRGLYNYIKGKKHMIISFKEKGDMKGLNVRTVNDNKDMVNALSTLVS